MSPKALALIATALLGIGLLVGFIPVSAQGANCGSAFARSSDALAADFSRALVADSAGVALDSLSSAGDACNSLRSVLRIPAIILLAGSFALFVASGVVNGRRHQARVAVHQARAEQTSERPADHSA